MRRSTAITLALLGGVPLVGTAVTLPLLLERAEECRPTTTETCPSTRSGSGGSSSSSSPNFVAARAARAAAGAVAAVSRGGFGATGSSVAASSGG